MKKQNLVPIPNPKMLHGGTLKDVIAIQVLNGFLSNTKFTASSSGLVMRAYNVADAMLKERFERERIPITRLYFSDKKDINIIHDNVYRRKVGRDVATITFWEHQNFCKITIEDMETGLKKHFDNIQYVDEWFYLQTTYLTDLPF